MLQHHVRVLMISNYLIYSSVESIKIQCMIVTASFLALLFSGEGNRCSTVLKKTSALLFSGEGNRCSTVLKRAGAQQFSGEGNRCFLV